MTPPVVITHNAHFNLFTPGEPASDELAAVAQDGITGPLEDLISTLGSVADYTIGDGPILPGESMTLRVRTHAGARLLTTVGMLASTNDGFYSIKSVRLPLHGDRTYWANAWDAGSEGNSENCDHIPGPPCGNAEVPNLDGAEGYVYIHSGIHGIGDLDPEMLDWNNPVAMIHVQRIR
jgi:hypothetical protein